MLVLLLGDFNFSRLEWVIGNFLKTSADYELYLIWVFFNPSNYI